MINSEIQPNNTFTDLSPASKVWIYSCDRLLTDAEVILINTLLIDFCKQWTAHNLALKAMGKILFNQFIILAVDESQTIASGCSIDKSVHFIKQIESQFNLSLFDRLTIFYDCDGKIKSFHFNDLTSKVASGIILGTTKIYDTTITQLGFFQKEFIKDASKSWLAKFLR